MRAVSRVERYQCWPVVTGRVVYVKTVQQPGMVEPPSSSSHAGTIDSTGPGLGPSTTTTTPRYNEPGVETTGGGPVAVKRMIIAADINSGQQVLSES